ncbi:hypothetical protein RP20_CCG028357 [Aedes albopictus]|nr:hypothetical protein RP20_CCG028357 [Aedes albopictus]
MNTRETGCGGGGMVHKSRTINARSTPRRHEGAVQATIHHKQAQRRQQLSQPHALTASHRIAAAIS